MKKEYISPMADCMLLYTENLLDASIKYENGDAPAPEVGGDAEEGSGSDSRRKSLWEDEEL